MRLRGVAAVAAVVLLAACSGGGEDGGSAAGSPPSLAPGAAACEVVADTGLRDRTAQLGWDASETLDDAYFDRVSDLDAEIADLLVQARGATDVHAALSALRKPLQAIRQAVNSGAETVEIDAETMVTAGTQLMGACADVGVDVD